MKKGKTINVITSSDQKYMPGLIALINSTIVRTRLPSLFSQHSVVWLTACGAVVVGGQVHTRNPLAFYIVADANPELHEQFQEFLYSLFPKGRFTKQTVSFKARLSSSPHPHFQSTLLTHTSDNLVMCVRAEM